MESGYSGGAEPWVLLRSGGGWAGPRRARLTLWGERGKDLGELVGSMVKGLEGQAGGCGDVVEKGGGFPQLALA